MKWDAQTQTLLGTSTGVAGEPYRIAVHLPPGYSLHEGQGQSACEHAEFVIPGSGTLDWRIPIQSH